MAPECIHNKPTSKASDVWSLGCILFQLHVGQPPFRGASDYLIFQLSLEARFSPSLDVISEDILPDDAKDLLKKIMKVDPKERLTIEEVLKHEYFKGQKSNKLDDNHMKLKEVIKDIISRINVWQMEGKDKLEAKFTEVAAELPKDEYWQTKVNHAIACAKCLVFDEDIDA